MSKAEGGVGEATRAVVPAKYLRATGVAVVLPRALHTTLTERALETQEPASAFVERAVRALLDREVLHDEPAIPIPGFGNLLKFLRAEIASDGYDPEWALSIGWVSIDTAGLVEPTVYGAIFRRLNDAETQAEQRLEMLWLVRFLNLWGEPESYKTNAPPGQGWRVLVDLGGGALHAVAGLVQRGLIVDDTSPPEPGRWRVPYDHTDPGLRALAIDRLATLSPAQQSEVRTWLRLRAKGLPANLEQRDTLTTEGPSETESLDIGGFVDTAGLASQQPYTGDPGDEYCLTAAGRAFIAGTLLERSP